jgi:hypothetical protein
MDGGRKWRINPYDVFATQLIQKVRARIADKLTQSAQA